MLRFCIFAREISGNMTGCTAPRQNGGKECDLCWNIRRSAAQLNVLLRGSHVGQRTCVCRTAVSNITKVEPPKPGRKPTSGMFAQANRFRLRREAQKARGQGGGGRRERGRDEGRTRRRRHVQRAAHFTDQDELGFVNFSCSCVVGHMARLCVTDCRA